MAVNMGDRSEGSIIVEALIILCLSAVLIPALLGLTSKALRNSNDAAQVYRAANNRIEALIADPGRCSWLSGSAGAFVLRCTPDQTDGRSLVFNLFEARPSL